jgi:flagellar motility protein MotE (MotC chaperone)
MTGGISCKLIFSSQSIIRKHIFLISGICLAVLFLSYFPAYCQEDIIGYVKKKNIELAEKAEALKREEERLNALRKDMDERIDKYTKVLNEIEEVLKKLEAVKNERMEYLSKTYESMPADEAALRLSEIDEPTAIKIILGMKNKKAAAVIAAMDPKKAASITKSMSNIVKKIPAR